MQPRGLAIAYLYPALLVGLAVGSAAIAYESLVDYRVCSRSANVHCLNVWLYFAFEGAVFLLLSLLAWRAVSRARAGKDMWTMRVYWPIVLGVLGIASLGVYVYTIYPVRGCSVGPVYLLWGCWDPGVTSLRVAVAFLLTALFTLGLALLTRGPAAAPPEAKSKGGGDEAPPTDESTEEIIA